jgi:hypothetical protein
MEVAMLTKPDIGKRQLDGDTDEDASTLLIAGWIIDSDDWWTRPARQDERNIKDNDCSVGAGIILAPDAASAIAFDLATNAK